MMESSNRDLVPTTAVAPSVVAQPEQTPRDQSNWAKEIEDQNEKDPRVRPWKEKYGVRLGGLNDENWVSYPDSYIMTGKGIKG